MITNLSGIWYAKTWLPNDLPQDKRVVLLPDVCPGKSPLPTGTVLQTRLKDDWRKYAVSDVGCGMRLLRSNLSVNDLTQDGWDAVADVITRNKGGIGDLGGGNHFLDALEPYDSDDLYFLIHTGSRNESGIVDKYVNNPRLFDSVYSHAVKWAYDNRSGVQDALEQVFGELEVILDTPHNTFEIQEEDETVIIRKGAVKAVPGGVYVIPSRIGGDVSLVTATEKIRGILFSLSHGTGRAMSRSEAKEESLKYDFSNMRKKVMMPSWLSNKSLRTEGPYAYRPLDECLELLDGYVTEVKRFSVIAYMGHL